MKVAMIDLIGEYNKWMAFNLKEETEIVKYISKSQFVNGDGSFLRNQNYDVILVAVDDVKGKDFLNAMFRCLGIMPKNIIFINDLNSWAEHETIAYEILKDNNINRRHTEFLTWKKFGEFASVTVDDISYLGRADDDKVMGDMYINSKNFAQNEMEIFNKLSEKFYGKLEGKYFLDIGANIGATSIYFYKKIDPDIQILAFEPDRLTYKILACNLILNDMLDVVKTENLILGENKNKDENENDETKVETATKSETTIENENENENEIENKSETETQSETESAPELETETETENENEAENEVEIEEKNEKIIAVDDYLKENNILNSEIKYIWINAKNFVPKILMGAEYLLSHSKVPLYLKLNQNFYDNEEDFEWSFEFLSEYYAGFVCMNKVEDGDMALSEISELKKYKGNENFEELSLFFVRKD